MQFSIDSKTGLLTISGIDLTKRQGLSSTQKTILVATKSEVFETPKGVVRVQLTATTKDGVDAAKAAAEPMPAPLYDAGSVKPLAPLASRAALVQRRR